MQHYISTLQFCFVRRSALFSVLSRSQMKGTYAFDHNKEIPPNLLFQCQLLLLENVSKFWGRCY